MKMTKTTLVSMATALLGMCLSFTSTAQVTLHFHERPPYVFMKDGQLTGLTGSPAASAFKDAGVQFTVASTPAAT